jgi:undecaprenyldiphospho-muramoylpentapeptide beta-N-acetylglucosaminyltransferase
MKKIVLTGGGTAGHVTPNIALMPKLKELGYDILYIGSYEGMEKKLIEKEDIPYRGISTGKLRRYFDIKNFTDPFRIIKGYFEAKKILKTYRPDIIFSKGGFVSVPVVCAAHSLKIPVIIHESDMTPGLANKLCFSSATKVCCNFPETKKYLPPTKAVVTGSPIRAELFCGDAELARQMNGFDHTLPVLMIVGGSLGSAAINETIRQNLNALLRSFHILHLCGKGNLDQSLLGKRGYMQYEYVSEHMKDFFALADVIVSRAGANAICEILALKKPNVLIPLATGRGDQLLNAASYQKQGFSLVLEEKDLHKTSLLSSILEVYEHRTEYIERMNSSNQSNGTDAVISLIEEITH